MNDIIIIPSSLLHNIASLAAHSIPLILFEIIFEYLFLCWITVIEPCLWYCVFFIYFMTLYYNYLLLVELEVEILWDAGYDYCLVSEICSIAPIGGMIYIWIYALFIVSQIIGWNYWLSLIYYNSDSPYKWLSLFVDEMASVELPRLVCLSCILIVSYDCSVGISR